MNEHDLLALREAVTAPGATTATLDVEIVVWLIDEVFRQRSIQTGLEDALERTLVAKFADEIELADLHGDRGDQ